MSAYQQVSATEDNSIFSMDAKPPEWFVKELKKMDPLLDVKWNGRDEHWVIGRMLRKPQSGDRVFCPILDVTTDGGDTLPLDQRTLDMLNMGDVRRTGPKRMAKIILAAQDQARRRREEDGRRALQDRIENAASRYLA